MVKTACYETSTCLAAKDALTSGVEIICRRFLLQPCGSDRPSVSRIPCEDSANEPSFMVDACAEGGTLIGLLFRAP